MCINCDENSTDIPLGIQGEQGEAGIDGTFGGFCGEWKWSTSTSTGPASTEARFNSSTYSAVAQINISDTNRDSVNYDAFLDSFDNNGSFGYIRLFKEYDSSIFWLGEVLAVTDNGTDHSIDVSFIMSNGAFAADDSIIICFTGKGSLPDAGQQRINTIFYKGDTDYISTTSAGFVEAGIIVLDGINFGDCKQAKIVFQASAITKDITVKITDKNGLILWNATKTSLTAGLVEVMDLGAVLLTPTRSLNYLKVEFHSDGVATQKLYALDIYNQS